MADFYCDLNKPEQTRLIWYMVDSTDKTTPKTGLTPAATVVDVGTIGFASAGLTIVEIGSGFYTHSGSLPTTQADAAGVLLYKLTGTNALDAAGLLHVRDPAASTVNANMVQISGDGAAADNLESFFDGNGYDASASKVGTVGSLTNGSGGIITLTTNWTAARAGYLDNLNIGGNVASAASISALSIPTANQVRDAVFANTTDGSLRFDELLRLMGSSVLALLSGAVSGSAGTATVKDIANSKTRFTWDYDENGNRTALSIVDKAL